MNRHGLISDVDQFQELTGTLTLSFREIMNMYQKQNNLDNLSNRPQKQAFLIDVLK